MDTAPVTSEPEKRSLYPALARAAHGLMLAVAAVFLALHWVHLKADFPNHSIWKGDWAKYTDEGWYGDAAIRFYQWGHWNVPGDFNPAAALPVWPLLEAILFKLTGVSVVAARAMTVAVFALILVSAYLLLQRWTSTNGGMPSLAPALGVLLLAVSPFCYAFTRLAILEPLLILLTLLAMLAASTPGTLRALLSGALLTAMVLTKTTGIFLFPSIFWLMWAGADYRIRPFLRRALPAAATAAILWSGYYLLLVRPRYLVDYRYLFDANGYTGVTRKIFVTVIQSAFSDGMWMGALLYTLGLLALAATLTRLATHRLRGDALPAALALWFLGYGFFLVYHNNLQPRYYLMLAIPLALLAAILFDELLANALARRNVRRLLRASAALAAVAVVATVANDAAETLRFVRHPQYTLLPAAEQVHRAIALERAADPTRSPLVLSISGSELSLINGQPSICDDFGTMSLDQRIATYRPGWYISWNDVEDDKMDSLAPMYRPMRVAAYPVFDDPERNLMILYRLDPVAGPHP